MCAMRDYNQEHQDSAARKYAYDFDWVLRKYLLKSLQPYFRDGAPALELGCSKMRSRATARLSTWYA